MFDLNSTDDEEAIAAVPVAPMAVDLTAASEAAPAAPENAELETSAQLEEIIGEEVDAPARAALLEEAGSNAQVAIENYYVVPQPEPRPASSLGAHRRRRLRGALPRRWSHTRLFAAEGLLVQGCCRSGARRRHLRRPLRRRRL